MINFAEMDDFEKFMIEYAGADTSRLLLSLHEWPVPSDPCLSALSPKDLAVNTLEARIKLMKKVPEWYMNTGLVYPTTLCAEQCSSSMTALYKAALAKKIFNEYSSSECGRRIADLTGGLGVDSWAFSKAASAVLFNEADPALAAAAKHNFRLLGVGNIQVSCKEASPDSLKDILGDFAPDLIFIDPARRDPDGNKVFLMEDCQPDVLKILPEMSAASRHILLKLSPMADITMVLDRLGASSGRVREIHILAYGGECKELLVWMDREWTEDSSIVCCEDGKTISFTRGEIAAAKGIYPDSTFARIVFEPGKTLTKAGAFNAICQRFGVVKFARFTHLYTYSQPYSDEELEQKLDVLRDFGKIFKVKEIVPMDKANLKDIGERYPHSEVTARNIPLASDGLRSRLGVSSGDDAHIFGVRIELPYSSGNYLIVTDPA